MLFSPDGERWDRLTQRGLDGGSARAVAADAERVVAVGSPDTMFTLASRPRRGQKLI